MFKKILYVILSLSIFSCDFSVKKDFNIVVTEFVNDYSKLFPDETPLSKNNPQLHNLHIPDVFMMDSVETFYLKYSVAMDEYNASNMTESDIQSVSKIKNILKKINAYLIDYHYNPLYFNVHFGFKRIMNSSFDTPEHRLQILFEKLEKVPLFYEAAKTQLQSATFQQTNQTIEDHLETYLFFDKTLPDFIKDQYHITPQYQARLDAAKLAIKDYVAFVESLKLK